MEQLWIIGVKGALTTIAGIALVIKLIIIPALKRTFPNRIDGPLTVLLAALSGVVVSAIGWAIYHDPAAIAMALAYGLGGGLTAIGINIGVKALRNPDNV